MQQNEVVDLQKFRDAEASADLQDETGPNYLPAGTKLLFGQYKIEGYLNCGGFGITYTARDSLNRKIVIKECFPSEMVFREGKSMRARKPRFKDEITSIVRNFVTEAHSLANLKNDNIIHVHQIFEENSTAYIAMDYIDGPDLLDLLESDKKLSSRQIQKLTLTMLEAIGYVHRMGMLHRDISPDNILVDQTGEPVLIDFGAVRLHVQPTQQAPARMKFVKDGYSPQEFYVVGAEQGTYSDLYSFAATIYHLVRGEAPADGEARRSALQSGQPDPYLPLVGNVKGYPQKFLAAIDKALAVWPVDRLQTAESWIEMIKPGIARLAIMSRPATAVMESLSVFDDMAKPSLPRKSRSDKTLLAAGISAVALLAGTAFLLGGWRATEPAPGVAQVNLPKPSPSMIEAAFYTPAYEVSPAIPELTQQTVASVTISAERSAPLLSNPTTSAAPAIGLSPVLKTQPTLDGYAGSELAKVSGVGRPESIAVLPTPKVGAGLPVLPAPLEPPPPLTGKLDIRSFELSQPTQRSGSFGTIEPVDLPVHVAALPRVAAEQNVGTDTTPPELNSTGEVLPTQISHSYWNVDVPFQTKLTDGDAPAGAVITKVSSDAKLNDASAWIAEGAIITHFDGAPLRPGVPLSIHVLDAMPTATDGVIRASVEYRDAVMGFAGAGELYVPILREIGLADGTVLETRRDGESWNTYVRELGASSTELRPGDIVIGEQATGRWFDEFADVEAALNALAKDGSVAAYFTVLRDGDRETARWQLARK